MPNVSGPAEEFESDEACPLVGAPFEQVDSGDFGPRLAFPVSEGPGARTTRTIRLGSAAPSSGT